jgi:periplasmic protein TonB
VKPNQYESPNKRKNPGAVAVGSVIVTALLFLALPFTQLLDRSGPPRDLSELSRAAPPPPPPPPENEPPPPEPEEQQQKPELKDPPPPLTLAQLEVALNPGAGNAMGDFAFGGLDNVPSALDELLVFELRDLDVIPRAIYQSQPIYPYEMRQAGVAGRVEIMFIVDDTGVVRQPRITSSSHREFEQAAIDAVMQWRFEPGTKDGKKVNTRVRQLLTFAPQRR